MQDRKIYIRDFGEIEHPQVNMNVEKPDARHTRG